MSLTLPPIPEVFFKTAVHKVESEFQAPPQIKQRLFQEALRLHNKSAIQRDAIRAFRSVLHGVEWSWPRAEALLAAEGKVDPDPDEILELLYGWLLMTTSSLFRRGQIRAVLSYNMGHKILVRVFTPTGSDTAPCGRADGEILEPTTDVLREIPPCGHIRCGCTWGAISARQVKRLKGQ